MHAASRDSLAAARERLDQLVDRSDPEVLGRVADELFAVVDLLDREPTLRRALSDSSVGEDDRARLLDRVLGRRLDRATADLMAGVVRSRWSTPAELTDAIDLIAQQAALAVAERGGMLDDVEDQIFRFGRILDAQPQLRALLADPRGTPDRRVQLLDTLIGDRVNSTTERLLARTVRAPRGRNLEVAIERLVELAAERRERYVAYVTAPAPLSAAHEARLAATLTRIYGRAMDLQVDVDPEVLGGLVIRVKDEVIDGSVARRLDEARHRLDS